MVMCELFNLRHPRSPCAPAAPPGGASRHQLVTAADLAAADIVLTTYDVLKRDVYHQPQGEAGEQRSLRHRKKYEVGAASVGLLLLSQNSVELASGRGRGVAPAEALPEVRGGCYCPQQHVK